VRQVQACIAELLSEGVKEVNFVGHSLGGLIARAVIAENTFPLGRVITVGTPHRGSQLADLLAPYQPYQWMTGNCGYVITTAGAATVPMSDLEMVVIAGGNRWGGYNPVLSGDNDGVVTVAETRVPNESGFHLVPSIHSYLTESKSVIRLILKAL
jgi:triacylglycerol esterase/lipase EstA (alpha/beta hydrolase family)